MTGKSSWWSRASTEQKLAQIDGGISLGMTAKQVAMCLRVDTQNKAETVNAFAYRNGRRFPTTKREALRRWGNATGKTNGINSARRAGKPDYEIVSAFSIFGDAPTETSLFDEVPA